MKKIHITIIISILLLFACKETGLNLKIRFDDIQGLQADNRVLFESNHIGQVTQVFYDKQGYYLVDLTIKEDFANAATEYSQFYIIEDSQTKGRKAIEIMLLRKGGTPLADGTVIEGSTRSAAVYQKMLQDFNKQAGEIGRQLEKFFEDLKKLPESDEVKQLQRDLEELGRAMEEAGKATREKIENEVVPMMKEELERLKKRLENFGREKEIEPLEEQLEKLTAT